MRKKKKKNDSDSEAWMLPYSDMLTLLLALFIVMFASAKVDDSKFQKISSEFGSIMALSPEQQNHKSAAVGGSNAIELDSPSVTNKEKDSQAPDPKTKKAAIKQENGVKGSISQQNQEQRLKEIAKSLNQTAAEMNLGKNTKASIKSDGLHLNLDSNILFDSGSADLTANSAAALKELGPKIQQLKENEVIIAGYTDNVPQESKDYPSNWELSAARAVSVMRFFVQQKAVTEGNVSIEAFGENNPKATNDTPAGRAKNRRVELVIKK